MIITRTPHRLSLFGGGTDYPAWFSKRPGKLLSAAMQHYCYITVRALPPFFDHHTRIVYSRMEDVSSNREIQHKGVRACLQYLNIEKGLEIHHDGDLPARSGIGSSSAFLVGLLNALYAFNGRINSPNKLAKEAIHVEQKLLCETVGIQDQIMAAYGGIRVVEMGPGEEWEVRPLVLPSEYVGELESSILMGFSGISRTASEYASGTVEGIKNESSLKELTEIASIADEAIDAINSQSDIAVVGELTNRSWVQKNAISSGLVNQKMHQLIETGIKAGAFGGKIMGAGGGGFFYFIAAPSTHSKIKASLHQVKVWVPIKFDLGGSQVIFNS